MSVNAAFYLNVALNIMQRSSVNKGQIDWTALRAAALERAAGAQTYADTYPAIEAALKDLGDRHSFFVPPQGAPRTPPAGQGPADSARVVSHRFGYIFVRSGPGRDSAATAARLQRLLQGLNRSSPCGWIVDLRSASGGTLFPMLAGLGPVLGEGVAAKIVYPSGMRADVFYTRGAAGMIRYPGAVQTVVVKLAHPASLDDAIPFAAVLTGRNTADAGEALAVAFRGRINTRSFGRPTAGFSTHRDTFRLSDGAVLSLATSVMADRTGQRYGGSVAPDIAVEGPDEPQPGVDDSLIDAAARWLTIQPSCARAMAWR
jgi:C-terminal processing protease CtpA/Prc